MKIDNDDPFCHESQDRMLLRDYFAAHAPEKPQPWFKPQMKIPRYRDRWVSDDGKTEYKTLFEAEQNAHTCFYNANRELQDTWDKNQEIEWYLQWPWAWADEIIKRRTNGKDSNDP